MIPLVFWQNIPSIHQAPLIRAVASRWPGGVLVVTEWEVSEERLRQGWALPDFAPARLIVAPTQAERRGLIGLYARADAVHIFSGLHAYPETYRTLKLVSRTQATTGVYAEPGWSNDGLRASARRLRYRLQAPSLRRRLDFLLATGETGIRWYADSGFSRERLFPFGYFVEHNAPEDNEEPACAQHREAENPIRLLFVGELASRKGVDLLLHALSRLGHRTWQLDVVGEGAWDERYSTLANDLGLGHRVRWLGAQSNELVRKRMAHCDALVLPSRHDGWGAVINEALMAGTPVIASNACGASDLVRTPWQGRIFQTESVDSLWGVLDDVIGRGKLHAAERVRIRTWAQGAISPEVAAHYLFEIITHVQGNGERPVAPWRLSCPR